MTSTETRSAERAEFLTDLLVTAVEGGIGYWSECSAYSWYCPVLGGGTATPGPGNTATAHAVLRVEDGDEKRIYVIGLDDIARALDVLSRGPVKGLSERDRVRIMHASTANDCTEADLDAGDADAVMQVACFGEVIYG